jgi:hypothetical protein
MKAQQLRKSSTYTNANAIYPGKPLMPEKIVQNRCFDCQPCRQQIIQFHRDEGGQRPELNANPDGSYQRETQHTETRCHANLSSR